MMRPTIQSLNDRIHNLQVDIATARKRYEDCERDNRTGLAREKELEEKLQRATNAADTFAVELLRKYDTSKNVECVACDPYVAHTHHRYCVPHQAQQWLKSHRGAF